MSEQTFNTRIVHKHDTEANWSKATNFIPKKGELIVYDKDQNYDYERIKVGDGATNVGELDFINVRTHWVEETENGEIVHKLDIKFLPDGLAFIEDSNETIPDVEIDESLRGDGAQSDWNANEGEPGYIKNRTHWVESGAVILEETTLQDDDEDGMLMLEGDVTLEVGKTYTVVYNGTEYMCTTFDSAAFDPEMVSWVVFGNLSAAMGTGDTGEPFAGINVPGYGLQIMDLSGASSCTIAIYGDIIHKIDPKFYERLAWIEVTPSTTILEETALIGDNQGTFTIEGDIPLEVAKTYTIVYNGTEYMCTAVSGAYASSDTASWVTFGNYAKVAGTGDTGEPFAGYSIPGYMLMIQDLSGATSCTIAISTGGEVIHKIDNKFIDAEWMATKVAGRGTAIIEEQTLTFFDSSTPPSFIDFGKSNSIFNITEIPVTAGERYIVAYDNRDYEVTAYASNDNNYTGTALGDINLITYPFFIIFGEFENDILTMIGGGDTSNLTHLVGLYHVGAPTLSKLPDECIPRYVATLSSIKEAYEKYRTHWTDEDGTVHQLDKKYIPAKWLADLHGAMVPFITDGTATSKPSGYATITAIVNLEHFDWGNPDENGTPVEVIYDGVMYNTVVRKNGNYIGNMSLKSNANEDTGEPFCLWLGPSISPRLYTNDTVATAHTISASRWSYIPNPMPEEYLPESVEGVVIRSSTEGSVKKFKLTIDDSGTISATEIVG